MMTNLPISFRPWNSSIIFLFFIAIATSLLGIFYLIYCYIHQETLLLVGALIITLIGITNCGWIGLFLLGKIVVSNDKLIIEHAAKLSNNENAEVQIWQWGTRHIDVSWEDIVTIKSSSGFWKFVLRNGNVYAFPVGWCDKKFYIAIAQKKTIHRYGVSSMEEYYQLQKEDKLRRPKELLSSRPSD